MLSNAADLRDLYFRKAAGVILVGIASLSLFVKGAEAGNDDVDSNKKEDLASPLLSSVKKAPYRLNTRSSAPLTEQEITAPNSESGSGTTSTAQARVPKMAQAKKFRLSANASAIPVQKAVSPDPKSNEQSDKDAETSSVTAVRTPPMPKVQTLRLSSRSRGIKFRTEGEETKKEERPKPAPLISLIRKENPDHLGESGFPGLFNTSSKKKKLAKRRLDLPSKVDYSPFRVESQKNSPDSDHGHSLGLSDEVIPFTEYGENLTKRPKTLTEVIEDKKFPENIERLEMIKNRPFDDVDMEIPERKTLFGKDRFLSPGPIDPGITMPSGATWRPSFMLFGNLRTGIQSYEAAGEGRINEWANRLDIFGNLYLTSTERLLIGFRPLDDDGIFTGVAGGSGLRDDGFQNGLDLEPHTFFFEGYVDEIFPFLDPNDFNGHDYGFSFGRQPFFLQDGIMANDDIDALAITKHNMFLLGSSNARISAWFGFNEINRGDNQRDSGARMLALTSSLDYAKRTIEADLAYVDGSRRHGGDGLYLGLGHIAQLGYWNSTFRLNRSFALNRKTAAIDNGWLLTHQLARTMRQSDDILTLSTFGELGNYTSLARGPATGGALGGFSLLQRAVGLGYYGSAISQEEGDVAGQIISYQHYLDDAAKKQILVAAGFSKGLDSHIGPDFTAALGLQYQQAISKHTIWRIGGFGTVTDDGEKGLGIRTELLRKF